MSEQIIAAELHRDEHNTVTSILFNGDHYWLANPISPAKALADFREGIEVSYETPLPRELLLPDPDLMASPEGDVKGLRELQDAAREAIRGPV